MEPFYIKTLEIWVGDSCESLHLADGKDEFDGLDYFGETKEIVFENVEIANCVRIKPLTWEGHVALRCDILVTK